MTEIESMTKAEEITETEEITGEITESIPLDECDLYGVKPLWQPETEGDVDWVLSRMADTQAKIDRVRKNADAQIRTAAREYEFFQARYGAALEAYAQQRLAGQKARTLTLLNGKLSLTRQPARIAIDKDDARVVAAVRERLPEMVRVVTTESVNRVDLAKKLRIEISQRMDELTGEIIETAVVVWADTGEPVEDNLGAVASVTPPTERFKIG